VYDSDYHILSKISSPSRIVDEGTGQADALPEIELVALASEGAAASEPGFKRVGCPIFNPTGGITIFPVFIVIGKSIPTQLRSMFLPVFRLVILVLHQHIMTFGRVKVNFGSR
jgi:hypothetical protein